MFRRDEKIKKMMKTNIEIDLFFHHRFPSRCPRRFLPRRFFCRFFANSPPSIFPPISPTMLLFPFADSWADSPPIPESDLGIGSALGSDPSPDLGLGVGLNLAGALGLGIDIGPGCQKGFVEYKLFSAFLPCCWHRPWPRMPERRFWWPCLWLWLWL